MQLIRLFITFLCLSAFFHQLSAQNIQSTPAGSGYSFRLAPYPAPPLKPVGGTVEPKWMYFWEFGDGHYSEEVAPRHTFAKTGDYTVNVYLTPAYSLDRPRKFTQKISVTQSGNESGGNYPALSSRNVIAITTNNNELVKGDELQLVVHYQPDRNYSSGKLVLAFNEKSSPRRSFRFVEGRAYAGEKQVSDIFSEASISSNQTYKDFLERQSGSFQSVYAWSYKSSASGKSSRLFVSMKVETPRVGEEIEIKAFLIPDSGPVSTMGTSASRTMMILASHDPNRINVIPRVVEFPVPTDTSFRYKVFFQNKGEGDANGIQVRVNLDSSLDVGSLELLDARIADQYCPQCHDSLPERASCIELLPASDYIDFVFRNVRLAGTQGELVSDNRITKGEIEFRMRPRLVESAEGKSVPDVDGVFSSAAIKFDTEDDTIYTNKIDTRFRIRTIGVKAGYNAGRNLSELVSNAKGLSNVTLSVSFSDNPIHKGQAWESELAYSSYRYTRNKSQVLIGAGDFPSGDSVNTSLAFNLYYLDVLGQSRYHFNDYIGIGFGGGFATLLAGTGKYDATLETGQERETVSQDVRTGLLFLSRQYETVTFSSGETFEPDIQNNPGSFLAMIMFAELGVGKVNRGPMAGIRYGSRFQNGLFDVSFARQNFIQFFFQWKI